MRQPFSGIGRVPRQGRRVVFRACVAAMLGLVGAVHIVTAGEAQAQSTPVRMLSPAAADAHAVRPPSRRGRQSAPRPTGPTAALPSAAEQPPFTSPDAILRWINGYRFAPEPQLLIEAVHGMRDTGVLKDQETNGVYVGFIAGALSDNQLGAEALLGRMFPLPPDDQVALIKAIAYSGLPDWQRLLGAMAERMPARKVLIGRYLAGRMKTLKELPLDAGPSTLDALWGYYFATGRFEPAIRIIEALAWSKEENSVEKLTVAAMAKWTLANNAARDIELLRLCQRELAHQQKPVTTPLKEVIEAAETLELAKLRRDALASIDDLKRKGPKKDRDIAWWANAGNTVLALGCVAAAAVGQVEFGLPCVIGGPVLQAATKYLVLPELLSQKRDN